jgi:hypothetical protein
MGGERGQKMNLLRNRSYKASMLSTFVVAIMATFSFTASYQSGADLISGTVMVNTVFNTVAVNGALTSTLLCVSIMAMVRFCRKVGEEADASTNRWSWFVGLITAATLTLPLFSPEGSTILFTTARVLPALPESEKTCWYWLFMVIRFLGFLLFLVNVLRALLVVIGGNREGHLIQPVGSRLADDLRSTLKVMANKHIWPCFERCHVLFKTFSARSVVILGAVISAAWVPWIVLLYPANIAADTVAQLVWARGDMPVWDPSSREDIPWARMSDHHPWMDTVLYGWFDRLGLAMGNEGAGLYIFAVLQTVVCAGAVAMLVCYLGGRLGVDWRLCAAGAAWYSIVPVFGRLAMVIVKDATFIPLFLVWITVFMEYVRRIRHSEKIGFTLPALLIGVALMCGLTRKVGLYVIVAAMVILLVIVRRRLVSLVCVALISGLSVGISAIAFPALRIAPAGQQESLAIPLQQTANLLIEHGSDLSASDQSAIARVVVCDAKQSRELFSLTGSDPIKDHCFNRRASRGDVARFLVVWAKQGLLHPRTYISAVPWVRNPFVMGSIYDEGFYVRWGWSDRGGLSILPQYAEGQRSVPQKYGALLYYMLAKLPVMGLLMSENLYVVWIPLLSVVLAIIRRRARNLVYVVPLLITIPLLVISPAYQTRYSWALAYGFFAFIALPWIGQRHDGNNDGESISAQA